MKRITILSAALIAAALTLTGCGNATPNEGSLSTSTSTSTTNTSTSESSGGSSSESSSSTSSESSSSSSSTNSSSSSSGSSSSSSSSSTNSSSSSSGSSGSSSSSNSSGSSGSSSSDSSSSADSSSSTPESSNGRARRMVDAAFAHTEEWTKMMNSITTQEEIDILMPGLKLDTLEDYCLMFDMVGINAQEILVAKPKAGSEGDVKAAFDARFDVIKDPGRFLYPAGEESIAGAVSGVTDDGYYYIVVHHMGSEIADAMAAAK